MSLPSNILIYFIWTVYGIAVLLTSGLWKKSSPSVAYPWLLSGGVLLLLRSLAGDSLSTHDAIIIMSAIAGILISYRLLMQLRFTRQKKRYVLCVISLAALCQALIGLIQFFHLPVATLWEYPPQQQRPYGIFQQVNVFSSFLACGIAATLCLCLHSWQKKILTAFFCLSLTVMGFMLFLTQSQTGWIGTILVVIFLLINTSSDRKKLLLPLFFLLTGVIAGLGLYQLNQMTLISHQSTSSTRLVLWKYCLELFLSRPWLGWGMGNFESVFLQQFGGQTTGAGARTVSHPHNEIILWAVEAGSAGLIAALLWVCAVLRLYLKGGKHQRMMLIVSLPVLLHTMTEYPLYQSSLHTILLVVLVRCSEPLAAGRRCRDCRKGRITLAVILLGFSALLIQTFFLQQKLTLTERSGQQSQLNKRPGRELLFLNERYQYDYQMGRLLIFNQTGDPQLLTDFDAWAGDYMRTHPEATLYAIRIQIAGMQGNKRKAEELNRQAKWLFPADIRWQ